MTDLKKGGSFAPTRDGTDRFRSYLKRVGNAVVRSVCKAIRPKIYDQRCSALLPTGLSLRIRRFLAVRPRSRFTCCGKPTVG